MAGGGAPPYERETLAQALSLAALRPDEPQVIPFSYRIDRLAQRYGVAPWDVEAAIDDPKKRPALYRALTFMRMEGSTKVSKQRLC